MAINSSFDFPAMHWLLVILKGISCVAAFTAFDGDRAFDRTYCLYFSPMSERGIMLPLIRHFRSTVPR